MIVVLEENKSVKTLGMIWRKGFCLSTINKLILLPIVIRINYKHDISGDTAIS